jgi:hypothetical protein
MTAQERIAIVREKWGTMAAGSRAIGVSNLDEILYSGRTVNAHALRKLVAIGLDIKLSVIGAAWKGPKRMVMPNSRALEGTRVPDDVLAKGASCRVFLHGSDEVWILQPDKARGGKSRLLRQSDGTEMWTDQPLYFAA